MSRSDLHLRFHCLTAILVAAVITALTLGCAAVGPPGGGPEDREAPVIVSTAPGLGEVRVDPGAELQITFSEGVSHASLAEALFISPPPSEKPRIRWRGRTAFIKLPEELPPDQTVTVTIGTGLKDQNNNALANSFTFAFSTGERIDEGRIEGLVFAETSAKGMLVGCWRTDIPPNDTIGIDPSKKPAPYVTQAGADNRFTLQHLTPGEYRVLTWSDKNNDRLYQPGVDALGLPWQDLRLSADSAVSLTLWPSVRDTGSFKLLLAASPDQSHINLRFSRTITISPEKLAREFVIRDSLAALSVIGAWKEARDSSRIVLWTSPQTPGSVYRIYFQGEEVGSGLIGKATPDSIGLAVSAFYPDRNDRGVPEQPVGWLAFNDALGDLDWKSVLSLTHADSLSVPLYVFRSAPNRLTWKTLEPLPVGAACRLEMAAYAVTDAAGNPLKDSLWVNTFSIIDPASTGEISGRIIGCNDRPLRVATRAVRGRSSRVYSMAVEADGAYKLSLLPADDYLLWAFWDRNANDSFDFGALEPFEPAERLTVCPDTVTVRARWESSKIDFNF